MTATPSTSTALQLGQRHEPLTLASPAREIHIAPATGEPGIFVTVRAYVGARKLANRRNVAYLISATRPDMGELGMYCRGTVVDMDAKERAAAAAWFDGHFGQAVPA